MSMPTIATTSADAFGTIAVAMITPFTADGDLDVAACGRLADKLVGDGCDAVVVNGTTGESPTTTDEEKLLIIRSVVDAVGGRAKVIAGSGSYNTEHSVELSKASEKAGADGLLVVTPYYSKPSQEGIYRHFKTVAESTSLPVCLYDIPPRSVVEIAPATIRRLAKIENIVAVKDAKGNLAAAAPLINETGLGWYSGDDPLNLAWLAQGATGMISVAGHLAASCLRELYRLFSAGDIAGARKINASLIPLYEAQAAFGGVSFAKASLNLTGTHVGDPRLPQVPVTGDDLERLTHYLQQFGVL